MTAWTLSDGNARRHKSRELLCPSLLTVAIFERRFLGFLSILCHGYVRIQQVKDSQGVVED